MFNLPHLLIVGLCLGIFVFSVARGDGLTVRLCKGIEYPEVKKGPLVSTSPKTTGCYIQPGSTVQSPKRGQETPLTVVVDVVLCTHHGKPPIKLWQYSLSPHLWRKKGKPPLGQDNTHRRHSGQVFVVGTNHTSEREHPKMHPCEETSMDNDVNQLETPFSWANSWAAEKKQIAGL